MPEPMLDSKMLPELRRKVDCPRGMAEGKPLVTAAFICERVLIEKDEVVTAVRIVDRIFYEPPATLPDQPTSLPPLSLLIILKRDDALDKPYDVDVVLITPSGRDVRPAEKPTSVQFHSRDPDSGVNLHVGLLLVAPWEEGLHWLRVSIDGEPIARTPLRLILRTRSSEET